MDIPVDQLAKADQELAQADTALDILIQLRREAELAYEVMGFDRVRKVAETMAALMPHATTTVVFVGYCCGEASGVSKFWERGGDGDLLLWLLLPGYICIDREGRRARWPHLYAAQDQHRKALRMGAVRDGSEIGHQLTDPNCQYGDSWGRGPLCRKCYPERIPMQPSKPFSIPAPPRWFAVAVIAAALVALVILAATATVAGVL